jgi:pyridoxine 5-phosphate synthase
MRSRSMTRLSVNLNKIALLRNSRRTGVPDVLRFATLARSAGADGITLHPRPDERHIRRDDVFALAGQMRAWRPHFELNLEGYPDERFVSLCSDVRPEQCTLVPDGPAAFTSEEGWKLDNTDRSVVSQAVSVLKSMGCRVIVFVDPDAGVVERVPVTGATGSRSTRGTTPRRREKAIPIPNCALVQRPRRQQRRAAWS